MTDDCVKVAYQTIELGHAGESFAEEAAAVSESSRTEGGITNQLLRDTQESGPLTIGNKRNATGEAANVLLQIGTTPLAHPG